MTTTASKDNSTPSHSSKPFFSKKGESSFFGQTKEAEQPFFLSRQQPVIQTKLTINEPGDKYEQEADAMSDRVMRMSVPVSEGGEESLVQTKPLNITAIQRKCAACEDEEKVQRQEIEKEESLQTKPLMRKDAGGGYTAPPQLASQLNSSKGGGNPLPGKTLAFMNHAFGADFSTVRIHTGSQAAEMSQGIQAKAFTHGSDVYFNQGQYDPESSEGKRLLSHELTHTIQQKKDWSLNRVSRQSANSMIIPTTAAIASVPWSFFWKEVSKRFAIRGATAAGLALVDGPLPIGDLIALGLSIWTIYEIISLWDVLWAAAAEEVARCQAVKNECIEECTDELPTGTRRGFPFWNCVNACMARNGCL